MGLDPTLRPYSTYKITIDYSRTLTKMIEAGKYYQVDEDFTPDNFPAKRRSGVEKIEVVLVHLGYMATTHKVLTELDRHGFRPATLPELLSLGAAKPGLQRKFPIMALGSVWQDPCGDKCAPILYLEGSERYLCLWVNRSGRRWVPEVRFLAVRKQ